MGDSMENMRNFNPKFSPFETGEGKNEGKKAKQASNIEMVADPLCVRVMRRD